jgi:hypothetical protein
VLDWEGFLKPSGLEAESRTWTGVGVVGRGDAVAIYPIVHRDCCTMIHNSFMASSVAKSSTRRYLCALPVLIFERVKFVTSSKARTPAQEPGRPFITTLGLFSMLGNWNPMNLSQPDSQLCLISSPQLATIDCNLID